MNKFYSTITCLVVGLGLGAQANAAIINNGGFEAQDTRTGLYGKALDNLGNGWDVYENLPDDTLTTGGISWYRADGKGIEVQTNGTLSSIDAHTGNRYIELDSDTIDGGLTNSKMQQDLFLDRGQYELSFWYSPRDSRQDSNGIYYEVRNGVLLYGNVTGPGTQGTTVGDWTLITGTFFVENNNTAIHVSFEATGTDNEYGGFIDDVSIRAVPLPAAAWLFGSALLGLAGISRRAKAT